MFNCADYMFAPYMGLYQEQGRHRDRLPVEDGRHHLAAAPFYFTFEIQQALAACEHVIDDDDSFPLIFPVML